MYTLWAFKYYRAISFSALSSSSCLININDAPMSLTIFFFFFLFFPEMVSFFFYFTGEPTSASLATCAITVPLLNGGQSNLFMEHTRLAANTENRATSLRFFFASSSRRYFPSDNYWIESRSVGSMMARDFRFQIKLQTSSGDRLAIAAVIGLFYVIFIFPLPHTQGTVTHLKQSRVLSYNLKFK